MAAPAADALAGTALTFAEMQNLMPLPARQMLASLEFALIISCVVASEVPKVALAKQRAPGAG